MISVKRETKEVMQTIRSFIKWVLIAHLTGAAGVPVEAVPAQDRR